MVPGRDQQQGGGIRADAVQGEQGRGAGGHQGNDELIKAPELAVEELRAPSQLPQRARNTSRRASTRKTCNATRARVGRNEEPPLTRGSSFDGARFPHP